MGRVRLELPGWGGCETRVTWVGGCETRVTWMGERVRQELPRWERG